MQSTVELKGPRLRLAMQEVCAEEELSVQPLTEDEKTEVLGFLSERPLHTVYMAGFIQDNGIVSPLNRGTFYGCRDLAGELVGVALIGHVTQVETRTDAALKALAQAAQRCSSAHVIMGEQERIETFWAHYARAGQALRLACRELLMEQRGPLAACQEMEGLRRASMSELPLVMGVQAEMAVAECGVNPLDVDPAGFRQRCARRVGRGRTWVVVKDDRLAFKADVMAETAEAVYLEGIHVDASERGRGYGRHCLSQLARLLLSCARSICLLVNEQNREAHAFYYSSGYRLRARYETIYLHK